MKKLAKLLFATVIAGSLLFSVTAFAAPESVTVIGSGWENSTYDSETGVLSNGSYEFKVTISGTEFTVDYSSPVTAANVVIPESFTYNDVSYTCTAVGSYLLAGSSSTPNESVTSLYIPATIATYKDHAFRKCTALKTVTFEDRTKTIAEGQYIFSECSSLEEITLPTAYDNINKATFNKCSNLKSVTLSHNTTTIGAYAFQLCTSLKEIVLPANVSKIDSEAFLQAGLERVICIGTSRLNTIGKKVFGGTPLKELIFTNPTAPKTMNATSFVKVPENMVVYYPYNAAGYDKSTFVASGLAETAQLVPCGGYIINISKNAENTVVNYGIINEESIALIALYDSNGVMTDVKSLTNTEDSVIFDTTDAAKAKIFTWESIASAKPFGVSYEYTVNN